MTWLITAWILAALAVLLIGWSLFWDRARGRRRCPWCWYDMAGATPDDAGAFTCPECGRRTTSEHKLGKTRRRLGMACAALIMLPAAYLAGRAPAIAERGWLASVPSSVLILAIPKDDLWIWSTWHNVEKAVEDGVDPATISPGPVYRELGARDELNSIELRLLLWRVKRRHEQLGGRVETYRLAGTGWAHPGWSASESKAWVLDRVVAWRAATEDSWARWSSISEHGALVLHAPDRSHDMAEELVRALNDAFTHGATQVKTGVVACFELGGDQGRRALIVGTIGGWSGIDLAEAGRAPAPFDAPNVMVIGTRLIVIGSPRLVERVEELVTQ